MPRSPFCAGTLARAKTQPPGISGQTWADFDRGPYARYPGATRGCVRAFSGAAWVKNTHFQKSGQFWRCLIPARCRMSGSKMCGAHSLSHGPLCQRKPHVQTCSSPSPMQSGRFDPLLFPLWSSYREASLTTRGICPFGDAVGGLKFTRRVFTGFFELSYL